MHVDDAVCFVLSEKQKKRQIEQVEDGIEELRERLRLSQAALDAEKEAEALRRNQVGLKQLEQLQRLPMD